MNFTQEHIKEILQDIANKKDEFHVEIIQKFHNLKWIEWMILHVNRKITLKKIGFVSLCAVQESDLTVEGRLPN